MQLGGIGRLYPRFPYGSPKKTPPGWVLLSEYPVLVIDACSQLFLKPQNKISFSVFVFLAQKKAKLFM